MTKEIVIVVEDMKLTETEVTKQLQAQGLQFSPDAGTIITAVFDANGSVLAKAMEAAGHRGAVIKHNVFMIPMTYALYLKDEKDKHGDIGLKNHLEAAAKTVVSVGLFEASSALVTAAASLMLAPGIAASATGVVAGCLVTAAADMVARNDITLYDYLRNELEDAVDFIKDALVDSSQSLDSEKAFIGEP